MKQFKKRAFRLVRGMSAAFLRFPYTVFCLVSLAALLFYIISRNAAPFWVEKSILALSVGVLLGILAQVVLERFSIRTKGKALLYGAALLLTAGYLAALWPTLEISDAIMVRTFVAIFALICAVLWVPSFRGGTDFNKLSLIHFKSFFTSLLYSAVMYIGIAAILFAVDNLLFSVHNDGYAYGAVIVGVLFAPLYYLSQLPELGQRTEEQTEADWQRETYTRFLEILVSYIAIPLFAAYTIVLLAYMVKILVTRVWPIGLLGPMVLIYSAVGIVLFVLASLPENRAASLFRRIFPKVWIPIVLMQMISVWIRLNAYGITESRYYVALFALFSLISAVVLSIRPIKANQSIALLAAIFALVSILPPVDAFTLSRNSQTHRLEKYLSAEGMLSNGELNPNPQASEQTKIEVTNILDYLEYRHSLDDVSWLPESYSSMRDMKESFGFERTYPNYSGQIYDYLYISLDEGKPLDIAGYDVAVPINSYRYMHLKDPDTENITTHALTAKGSEYTLTVERSSGFDVLVSLRDASSKVLVQAELQDYMEQLQSDVASRNLLPPEALSFVETGNEAQLKIIFRSINATIGGPETGADYSAYILAKVP